MKTILKITTLSAVLLGLAGMLSTTSCGKKCIGFPEHLVDYYPYKVGDTLRFENSDKDTLSFFMWEYYWIKETTYGACSKCECNDPIGLYFQTREGNDSISIGGWIEVFIKQEETILSCWFTYIYVNGMNASDNFSKMENTQNAFNSNHASLFGDTVTLFNENAIRINRVVIVKGEGIVEFFDAERNCLWKKIN
ncbi:MAG: hypothetical protein FWG79_09800 [Bacteroidales bacterium]|nr:hypothetical protein [Bacteroidales bacterium]